MLGHSAGGLHAVPVAQASGGKGPVSLKEVLPLFVSLSLSLIRWPLNDQRTCCCLFIFLLTHR